MKLILIFLAFVNVASATDSTAQAMAGETTFGKPLLKTAPVKLSTAIISWVTVLALLPVIPKALAFPSLAAMTGELQQEVAERKKAEAVLLERVAELARANADLERFNQLSVGREQRMIELKREVNALLVQAGQPPAHDLKMLDEHGAA